MLKLLRLAKRFLFDVSMDATVFSLLSLSKKALAPIVKAFLVKTGSVVTDEMVDQVIAFLPTTEKDEQHIDDALIYAETVLKEDTVREAWTDHMALIKSLSSDPKESEQLLEYYRRFSIKEKVEKTAQKIITDTHMTPAVFLKYIEALSIRRKVLEPKYKSFLDFAKKEGKDLVTAAKKYNDDVTREIDKATNKLEVYNDAQEAKIEKWKKWL